MSQSARQLYQFDQFYLDTAERLLIRNREAVTLTPKVFDALLVLVESSGHLVSRDELMKAVWPDTFVDEHTLTQTVSAVRKALGEGQNGDKHIETVPRLGYRFVASVRKLPDTGAGLMIERHTRSRLIIQETETSRQDEASKAFDKPFAPSRAVRQSSKIAMAVLSLIAAVAIVYFFASIRSKPTDTATGVKSIAVLPFRTLGEQESDEYLGLGLADALITRLGSFRQIVVRPTSAVQRFANDDRDAVALGRALGVDAVLEGRVQRLGDRVRVTAQLVSVRDGTSIWTGKFDENLADVFAVQDSISNQIAQTMALNLTGEEKQRLAKRYTESSEAYEAYSKGRYFWNKRTNEGFKKAIEHFEQAISLDSNYALAYAGLADCYSFLYDSPKAKQAATKALSMDDALAEAHAALGNVFLFYEWNWPAAERELKRAIELNANYATARHWYAYYLVTMGRMDEAIAEIKHAQEIDPLSLIINTDLGQLLYFARQYDKSIVQLRKTIDMDPNFVMARYRLGDTYVEAGMYDEAIAEYKKCNAIVGNDSFPPQLARAYALSGNWSEAIKEREKFLQLREPAPNAAYCQALICTAFGEKDEALRNLEKTYKLRSGEICLLKVNPVFDSLRSEPRFQNLLRRLRFLG